jgi:hypothetical protein
LDTKTVKHQVFFQERIHGLGNKKTIYIYYLQGYYFNILFQIK